jgi:hypothetical protein
MKITFTMDQKVADIKLTRKYLNDNSKRRKVDLKDDNSRRKETPNSIFMARGRIGFSLNKSKKKSTKKQSNEEQKNCSSV